jgi:hypothetical protein
MNRAEVLVARGGNYAADQMREAMCDNVILFVGAAVSISIMIWKRPEARDGTHSMRVWVLKSVAFFFLGSVLAGIFFIPPQMLGYE